MDKKENNFQFKNRIPQELRKNECNTSITMSICKNCLNLATDHYIQDLENILGVFSCIPEYILHGIQTFNFNRYTQLREKRKQSFLELNSVKNGECTCTENTDNNISSISSKQSSNVEFEEKQVSLKFGKEIKKLPSFDNVKNDLHTSVEAKAPTSICQKEMKELQLDLTNNVSNCLSDTPLAEYVSENLETTNFPKSNGKKTFKFRDKSLKIFNGTSENLIIKQEKLDEHDHVKGYKNDDCDSPNKSFVNSNVCINTEVNKDVSMSNENKPKKRFIFKNKSATITSNSEANSSTTNSNQEGSSSSSKDANSCNFEKAKLENTPLKTNCMVDNDGWQIYNPNDFEESLNSKNSNNESSLEYIGDISQNDLNNSAGFNKKTYNSSTHEFDGYHYPHSQILMEQLREKFGLTSFRPNQLQAINAALLNNDCFILMPTGGGKSLCYQLPAILTPGVTIVISPLKSLITDQVYKLMSLDIPVTHLSGTQTESEANSILAQLAITEPMYKLLYVTPEKITSSKKVQNIFENLHCRGKLARFVIDEAHCVSQWGHDFRPDYKRLSLLRSQFKNVPMMILTATATPRVKFDILKQLRIENAKLFVCSFNRPNIKYSVLEKRPKFIVDEIVDLLKTKFKNDAGIIYCLSRKDCEQLARDLSKNGIEAVPYHAGLTDKIRDNCQKLWIENKYQVLCATIAFGMGIDKPDVRYVIHHTLPKSLEGYYQESGRAGRDGETSYSILYYNYADTIRLRRIIERGENATADSLNTHFENLKNMIYFCENRIDCRRKIVLNYFGEEFTREQCLQNKETTCDNCFNFKQFKMTDVTEDCKAIIECVTNICTRGNFTLLHLTEIFRGSNVKKIVENNHNKLPLHGRGANWIPADVHRLFRKMVLDGYLTEEIHTRNDIPLVYIKRGKNAHKLLNNSVKVEIALTTREEKEAKAKSKSADLKVPTSKSLNDPKNDIHYRCYEELLAACRDISREKQVSVSSIINVQAIKEMSKNLPVSEEEMFEIPHITKANFEKYGKKFLSITQNYACIMALTDCSEDRTELNEPKQNENNCDEMNWEEHYDFSQASSSNSTTSKGYKRKRTYRSSKRGKKTRRSYGNKKTSPKSQYKKSSNGSLGLMQIPQFKK